MKEPESITKLRTKIKELNFELENEKKSVALERCKFKPNSFIKDKETGDLIFFVEPEYVNYNDGYILLCRRINKTTGKPSKRTFYSYDTNRYEQLNK